MSTRTFNPTDVDQSAANWLAARRIVDPFAPHGQTTPDLTLGLDPGALLNGSVLTEAAAQTVGPFSPPGSGFRIDRVVINRTTGVASVVTGAVDSLTPPALPAGALPVARVMLLPTTDAVTNDMVVDERVFADQAPSQSASVVCRATRGGTNQTGVTANTDVKVLFTATDFNVGGGFNTGASKFQPTVAGYYQVSAHVSMNINSEGQLICYIFLNGSRHSTGRSTAINTVTTCYGQTNDIIYMNGSTDYLEVFTQHTGSPTNTLYGDTDGTYFTAARVG